jgi:putative GTP pyrophosphokinase
MYGQSTAAKAASALADLVGPQTTGFWSRGAATRSTTRTRPASRLVGLVERQTRLLGIRSKLLQIDHYEAANRSLGVLCSQLSSLPQPELVFGIVVEISKTKIDEAGELLRDWMTKGVPDDLNHEPLDEAVRLLMVYRNSFTAPSRAVESLLGALVAGVVADAKMTGRPKRGGAIVFKLVRHHGMRLTQMADIAGLRVRFPNGPSEVQRLVARIEERWAAAKIIDYVARPKPTGYRAIHALVSMGGRTVEVQLRTARQNRWADQVELAGDRLGYRLKDGEGPEELVRYFERAAYKLAIEEQGGELDEAFQDVFEDLRQQVRHYFA